MEKEKSIRVSESTYNAVRELSKKRLQSIKTIVQLCVENFVAKKSKFVDPDI